MAPRPELTIGEAFIHGQRCAICGAAQLAIVHMPDLPDFVACPICDSAFIVDHQGSQVMYGKIAPGYPQTEQAVLRQWTTFETVERIAAQERPPGIQQPGPSTGEDQPTPSGPLSGETPAASSRPAEDTLSPTSPTSDEDFAPHPDGPDPQATPPASDESSSHSAAAMRGTRAAPDPETWLDDPLPSAMDLVAPRTPGSSRSSTINTGALRDIFSEEPDLLRKAYQPPEQPPAMGSPPRMPAQAASTGSQPAPDSPASPAPSSGWEPPDDSGDAGEQDFAAQEKIVPPVTELPELDPEGLFGTPEDELPELDPEGLFGTPEDELPETAFPWETADEELEQALTTESFASLSEPEQDQAPPILDPDFLDVAAGLQGEEPAESGAGAFAEAFPIGQTPTSPGARVVDAPGAAFVAGAPPSGEFHQVVVRGSRVHIPKHLCAHCLRTPVRGKIAVSSSLPRAENPRLRRNANFEVALCAECRKTASLRSRERREALITVQMISLAASLMLVVAGVLLKLADFSGNVIAASLIVLVLGLVGYSVPLALLLPWARRFPETPEARFVRSTLSAPAENEIDGATAFNWRNAAFAELFTEANKARVVQTATIPEQHPQAASETSERTPDEA